MTRACFEGKHSEFLPWPNNPGSRNQAMHARELVVCSIGLIRLMASIPGNMFIFIVNIMDLVKHKGLGATEQLITGISMFSLLLELQELSDWFSIMITFKSLYGGELRKITFIYFLTVMLCYLWFCSWLCVHFCLKIVNISRRCYTSLQRGFSKMFPWLLIPSVLGPILLTFSVAFDMTHLSSSNSTLGISNQVKYSIMLCGKSFCSFQAYVAACSLGFLLCSASAVTIISSLYRHMKHMRDNAEGSRSPNVEAHIRAVKTVTSILVLNLIIFTALMLAVFNDHNLDLLIALSFLGSTCHFLSSLNLIKGNNTLKKKLSDIVTYFRRKFRCPALN
ncbi:taste receptor type 2 member 40-like [Pelodytes ibericus]